MTVTMKLKKLVVVKDKSEVYDCVDGKPDEYTCKNIVSFLVAHVFKVHWKSPFYTPV